MGIVSGAVYFVQSTRHPSNPSQFYVLECIRKRSVDRFVCLFCLLFHIIGDIPFIDAAAFFLPAFLESGEFFFMAAGADELLCIAFSDQFHLFVADRAAGIGVPGDSLPVSAFSVLAYQHFAVLPIYRQHSLSAHRTFCIGKIIMVEGPLACFDLPDNFFRIIFYVF